MAEASRMGEAHLFADEAREGDLAAGAPGTLLLPLMYFSLVDEYRGAERVCIRISEFENSNRLHRVMSLGSCVHFRA